MIFAMISRPMYTTTKQRRGWMSVLDLHLLAHWLLMQSRHEAQQCGAATNSENQQGGADY
jgi:hypothetical protein